MILGMKLIPTYSGDKTPSVSGVTNVDNVLGHIVFTSESPPAAAHIDLDISYLLDFGFSLDLSQLEVVKAVNSNNNAIVVASTSASKSVIPYHVTWFSLSHSVSEILVQ
jgi:hypothetical protein